jgi:hypothetical protein
MWGLRLEKLSDLWKIIQLGWVEPEIKSILFDSTLFILSMVPYYFSISRVYFSTRKTLYKEYVVFIFGFPRLIKCLAHNG